MAASAAIGEARIETSHEFAAAAAARRWLPVVEVDGATPLIGERRAHG